MTTMAKVQKARQTVAIVPPSLPSQWSDVCMVPLMYALQGTWKERAQETHFWNNRDLTPEENAGLDVRMTVKVPKDTGACPRWRFGVIPLFHMPVFGGWKNFAVIEPLEIDVRWYIGWILPRGAKVSLLPNYGPVRTLRGPDDVPVFAVDAYGRQIRLRCSGHGSIGSATAGQAMMPLR